MHHYRTGSIVFDIETIPDQKRKRVLEKQQEFFTNFKISNSLSKTELAKGLDLTPDEVDGLSKADLQERKLGVARHEAWEKAYRATALDGGIGEIVSIAWMNPENKNYYATTRRIEESEAKLLAEFNSAMSKVRSDRTKRKDLYLIGHGIESFDLKFLWKRFVVNGINPCFSIPIHGRHGIDYYDTMLGWSGKPYGDNSKKSLDFVCKALGLEGKVNIDGSMVWDLAKEGKTETIREYNIDDVEKTFSIYKRLNFIEG